jgi:cell division protein FtsB
MKGYYALFLLMVITIPVFLWANAWQSNDCGILRNEIRRMEKDQENTVEENKTAVAEIADLLAVDKLENDARNRLGLKRIRPENVLLIIMGGGKGRGL